MQKFGRKNDSKLYKILLLIQPLHFTDEEPEGQGTHLLKYTRELSSNVGSVTQVFSVTLLLRRG